MMAHRSVHWHCQAANLSRLASRSWPKKKSGLAEIKPSQKNYGLTLQKLTLLHDNVLQVIGTLNE